MNRRLLISEIILLAVVLTASCSSSTSLSDDGEDILEETDLAAEGDDTDSGDEGGVNQDAVVTPADYTDAVPDDTRISTANTDAQYSRITYVWTTDIPELDPFIVRVTPKASINAEVFETLYDYDENDELCPRLASEDIVKVDDTHYQVTIYDYIVDSEGNSITASDVIFSYDMTCSTGDAYDWDLYAGAVAIDDYTIEFTFIRPLTSLSAFRNLFTRVYIVSEKSYYEHDMSVDPIGTGPYEVTAFIPSTSITLRSRSDYWQTDELRSERAAANVRTIQVNIEADESQALAALLEGSNDYMDVSDSWTSFAEGGIYEGMASLYRIDSTESLSLIANTDEASAGADINFRRAVYYAIDAAALCDAIGVGTAFPCSADLSPMSSEYQLSWDSYAAGTYQEVYDPDLAKEYLAQSGYSGETIVIITEESDQELLTARLIHGYLSEIGISCELRAYDKGLITSYMADSSGWDLVVRSYSAGSYAVSKWISEFDISSSNDASTIFIEDDTLKEMLSTCNTIDGYSAELTKAIGEYLIDNAYSYGLAYTCSVYAFHPAFASIYLDGGGNVIFGACEYYLDL